MRSLFFSLLLCCAGLNASESPRVFPLWDGVESVASYAQRVGLSPTKQIDLGGGVTLDLVLIPAGTFVMGTPEPEKPAITEEGAAILIVVGGILMIAFASVLVVRKLQKKKVAFSLRYLLVMTIFCGTFMGGIARLNWARAEQVRYDEALKAYLDFPKNEKPAHAVTLTQPFYMGKFTVTQAQYEAVIGSNPNNFKGAQLPVEWVSWDDAKAFCKKLNGLSPRLDARLPTEAQWEFACRAGTRTVYYSGDQESDLDAVAWFDTNSGGTTHPVGTKKPNAFGLFDMHGNVWQWCEDGYGDDYYASSPERDPKEGPATGMRISRGGSWNFSPNWCRSAQRFNSDPGGRNGDVGFRICVALDF